jgi:hypothetical protein
MDPAHRALARRTAPAGIPAHRSGRPRGIRDNRAALRSAGGRGEVRPHARGHALGREMGIRLVPDAGRGAEGRRGPPRRARARFRRRGARLREREGRGRARQGAPRDHAVAPGKGGRALRGARRGIRRARAAGVPRRARAPGSRDRARAGPDPGGGRRMLVRGMGRGRLPARPRRGDPVPAQGHPGPRRPAGERDRPGAARIRHARGLRAADRADARDRATMPQGARAPARLRQREHRARAARLRPRPHRRGMAVAARRDRAQGRAHAGKPARPHPRVPRLPVSSERAAPVPDAEGEVPRAVRPRGGGRARGR